MMSYNKTKGVWTQWIKWLETVHVSGGHRGGPWFFGRPCWILPPSMPTQATLHNTLAIWGMSAMHVGFLPVCKENKHQIIISEACEN